MWQAVLIGTDAHVFGFMSCNIKSGDEVINTSFTFFVSAGEPIYCLRL